jgi:peroxiredoxin
VRRTFDALLISVLLISVPLVSKALCGATRVEEKPVTLSARIGEIVDDLRFKDIRFARRSLDDFSDAKALVIVFTDTHCPVASRYMPRLEALWREYRSRGVVVLGMNASPDDSMVEMAAYALEKNVTFPQHKDFDQSVMRTLGVERTPEVVVLDARQVLRYRGRIDDQFRTGGARPTVGRSFLREAIEAALAGKSPKTTQTPVDGCKLTLRRAPSTKGANYCEHVAPILQTRCQPCHRPHQQAPFSLLKYSDARRHADRIREVVEERQMPPSFSDPRHGDFSKERTLSRDEIDTILSWVDAGVPEGDRAKLPKPIEWPDGEWTIDEPDLVLEASESVVPATGYVDYKYLMFDHVFPHDTWINQIQILPGNRRVVHHANLYAKNPKSLLRGSRFITGHVPGGDVTRYGKGAGILLRAGSRLRLQIHYTTTGREERDRTRVGLVFVKETVRRKIRCMFIINRAFAIPPGDPAYEVSSKGKFTRRAVGIGLFTHMHLRGRDMGFTASYPDGRRDVLLSIPNYSFDWQLAYRWKDGEMVFPAGTEIATLSHYDNSRFNPFNPDPTATVREGPQSYHEMNYGFVFYYELDEKLDIAVDPKTGRPRE